MNIVKYMLLAAIATTVTLTGVGARTDQITQRRINEYAAACETSKIAMSGLKGTRLSGEDHNRFTARISNYFKALDSVLAELDPLKGLPPTRDASQENMHRWNNVKSEIGRLHAATAKAKMLWKIYPSLKQKSQLGESLLSALNVTNNILNLLRDARP